MSQQAGWSGGAGCVNKINLNLGFKLPQPRSTFFLGISIMIFFPTDVTEQHYGIRIRGQHVTLSTTRVVAIAPNQSLLVCFIANEVL